MKGSYPSTSGQMRLSISLILSWTIFFSICLAIPYALAAKDFKIGIINPQTVFEKSKAGKRSLGTMQEHAAVRRKLLTSDQKELTKLEEEIRNDTNLTNNEKQSKQKHLQQKFQEYRIRGQEFQQELREKQNDIVKEYMKKIESVTKSIAEKHGFSLILDEGSETTLKIVLYSRSGLNITNEVLKEFNKRFP